MIVRDENAAVPALAIVEKYETLVAYLYPILQNCPRRHGIARDRALDVLLGVPELLYGASASKQVSKLYAVDGALATLRFWLRFFVHADRKVITPHQQRTALAMLAEVGRMLGGWQRALKGRG